MKKVVIAGAGELGVFLAKRLASEGQHVMVLDRDLLTLRELQETTDIAVSNIDIMSFSEMRDASIEGYDLFFATMPSDEGNLVACRLADVFGIKQKIAITHYLGLGDRALLFSPTLLGVDGLINVNDAIKQQVLRSIEICGANDFASFGEGQLSLLGCQLTADSLLVGQSMDEVTGNQHQNHFYIAHAARQQKILTNADTLKVGDYLHVVTQSTALSKVNQQLGLPSIKGRRVVIYGDNFVSEVLATTLAEHHFEVCLLYEHPERKAVLERQIKSHLACTLIPGNGTDVHILNKVGLDQHAIFIASSKNDANNLNACMLAKGLGSNMTIAMINHQDWSNIALKAGVDVQITQHAVIMHRVEQIVHDNRLTNYHSIQDTHLEMVELVVGTQCEAIGIPLPQLKLPEQAKICGVKTQTDAVLPHADLTFQAGDKVLILTSTQQLEKVENYFTQ